MHDRNDEVRDVGLEAIGNKASHDVSGARWVAASVPRTGQCMQEWTQQSNSQGRDPRTMKRAQQGL